MQDREQQQVTEWVKGQVKSAIAAKDGAKRRWQAGKISREEFIRYCANRDGRIRALQDMYAMLRSAGF